MVNYTKYLDLEIFVGEISFHEYPWHFHDCFTLIVVENGLIKYEFHNKSVNVEAGEGFIIEPTIAHRNTISQPTNYKAIFIPQEYFQQSGQNKLLTQKVIQPNVVNKLVALFNIIELKYSKKEIGEIVFELCELLSQTQLEVENDSRIGINIVPKIEYGLTITELAEKAHLSKFHFQRKFKKDNGLTVGQLKQQEKTIAAKTLLENGKLSTDVAHELGFFDQSHFIKYFKKMWVINPKNLK